ncbi:DUF4040 family protein [Corynebacterium suicordis]|uniref:DUF4040 family protein n=1 Tax=Corynebacterium suicordis DSM 45110 TaxID=1121369 RepID=A0ABR9ZGZ8_9CORY|nr:DUF4040 family protein [Corynebacterium suicordis]MBF4552691.1 DUF4040 family protein [Corynebacterium suicordis DSM 45110]MDR6278350.1 multicomponent Na+:H+ antiporter subunit A [Corynebacterium suicordis]
MAILAVPLIVAVALLFTPVLVKIFDRAAGWPLAITFAVLAGYVISHAEKIIHGETLSWSATWIPGLFTDPDGHTRDVEFALRLDSLSLFFTLLALTIGAVVFIYSTRYLHHGSKILSFYLLMTTFMLAVILLVLADDVMLLFVGWELVSLASFFLIARSGSSGEAGSIRTLTMTFIGGLFLLAALAVMVSTTGTTRLSEIITSPAWEGDNMRLAIVAVLLALAGFSKAAQFPFHFWLPEAMAADTPVSAFLHAAAVVKAGIYLLMRFSGLFQDVMTWHILLIVVGMLTAVMGAVFALQKTDLKKLTAYSTVSQLGWIVAAIGVGTPFALGAALVHTASHALFKSSLFMVAGVVDHQAGSRDIKRLGSLWRQMPFTFTGAAIAAASMAAIPPTFGFVSKEGMLDSFTEAPFPQWGIIALLIVAGLGALATFLYSARYITGAFIDGPRDCSQVKEAEPGLWIPAVLPGVLSLPVVLFLSAFDHPLDAMVAATGVGETHSHLALWHGLKPALFISIAVLIVGAIGVVFRKQIARVMEGRKLAPFTGARFLEATTHQAQVNGRRAGIMANSLSPNRHVLWILGLIGLLAFAAFAAPGAISAISTVPPRMLNIDRPTDLISLALILLPVLGIITTRSRLASVILLGIVGVGVSWMMLTLGAPDVATTNLLVEFLVVILMMLVLRHQPRLYLREGDNRSKLATAAGVFSGLIAFFGVFLLLGRHDKPEIARWYLENTPDLSGGNNVVAVILVEFRAFDTLGELIVLGMAGIVIAAIVQSIPRSPLPGYGPGSTSELFRAEGTTRFPDVHKVPELAPFYSKYLRSTYLNSILPRQALPYVLPLIGILSAVTFWRGHQAPGGAFLAALIAAGGLLLWYVSQSTARRIGGNELGHRLIAAGAAVALLTGLVGLLLKGSFLEPIHGYVLGVHLTTSLLFDLGVYFAVLGLIVVVINQLGGRDRPGAEPPTRVKKDKVLGTPMMASEEKKQPRTKGGRKLQEALAQPNHRPAPVESQSRKKRPDSEVAIHAGGSDIVLNPSEVNEERKRKAELHRQEREAARKRKAKNQDEEDRT